MSPAFMKAVRKELIARREQLGWSTARLADEMGASWSQIRDLEEGHTHAPSIETIIRWGEALHMETRLVFRPRAWNRPVGS